MNSYKALIINELNFDIENVLIGYKTIRNNFSDARNRSIMLFDLLILAINSKDDIKLIKHFRELPEYNPVPIVCFLSNNTKHLKNEALKIGAEDYFILPADSEEVKYKINSVIKRSKWTCKSLLLSVIPEFYDELPDLKLTNREKDLLKLISKGLSNLEISDTLCLSEMTVKTHLKNIFKKLNVSNRTQAVLVGYIYDLIKF